MTAGRRAAAAERSQRGRARERFARLQQRLVPRVGRDAPQRARRVDRRRAVVAPDPPVTGAALQALEERLLFLLLLLRQPRLQVIYVTGRR
jgi:hypothetical protein